MNRFIKTMSNDEEEEVEEDNMINVEENKVYFHAAHLKNRGRFVRF